MKIVTSSEMSEIDRSTIEELSVPGEILMNNAGKYVADHIVSMKRFSRALIFCGMGNNGGDGLTAAYYLHAAGINVTVVLLSHDPEKLSETSLYFYRICKANQIKITDVHDGVFSEIVGTEGLVVIDSIFGTGFRGESVGDALKAIELINSLELYTVSVDIPSGMESDGYVGHGTIVKADQTITIGLPKISLVTWPGKKYTGSLITASIGFPESKLNSEKIKRETAELPFIRNILDGTFSREADLHKGDRGHCLIIGGFTDMEGAAILAAGSAFNCGAGLVTVLTCPESRGIIAGKVPEAMTASIDFQDINITLEFIKERRVSRIVVGPGMGRSERAKSFFYSLISELPHIKPHTVIIDGDGLYFLAEYLRENTLPEGISFILTPHLMEASRFFDEYNSFENIKMNRLFYAEKLAEKTGSVVVLKGPASIVTDSQYTYVNTTGNSAMATAGSGDVLSGMAGEFSGRFITNPLHAAMVSVFVHGMAGDIALEENRFDNISSRDISLNIADALKNILNG